jgi:hypothetical protein
MDTLLKLLDGPYGGHSFKSHREAWTQCVYCYGTVSLFELDEGLWPARLGLDCPALIFKLTPTHTPGE